MIIIGDIVGEKINEALSLSVIGINEYAWNYNSIVEMIPLLREKRLPILVGDVFIIENGIIKPTYDSWYYKIKSDCDYEDSYKKTIDYIKIFEGKEDKYVYSIVL